MNRKGGPIGADRDPSKSEICAGNQRDGRKSKGSLFGAESQPAHQRVNSAPVIVPRLGFAPRCRAAAELLLKPTGNVGKPEKPSN
jgi:hypothetical protein